LPKRSSRTKPHSAYRAYDRPQASGARSKQRCRWWRNPRAPTRSWAPSSHGRVRGFVRALSSRSLEAHDGLERSNICIESYPEDQMYISIWKNCVKRGALGETPESSLRLSRPTQPKSHDHTPPSSADHRVLLSSSRLALHMPSALGLLPAQSSAFAQAQDLSRA
jgi:hypothetical protein